MIDFHILSFGTQKDDGSVRVGTQVMLQGSVMWQTSGTIPTEDLDDIHSLLEEQLTEASAWIMLTLRGTKT